MIHHSSTPYAEAASAAAKKGKEKMEAIIHRGIASAESVIKQVQERIVKDSIVRSSILKVSPADAGAGWRLSTLNDAARMPIHQHAFGQILDKASVPTKFADFLDSKGQWGREELGQTLTNIYNHSSDRNLVRQADGSVMGFLSDRFRRLDSRPLLDAFIGASNSLGLVPIEGVALDTKVRMRAVLPKVFEPIDNEVMLFGLEWGNSDFGDGGHCVSLWTMRVWCTNLAIGEQCMRQVHLGKRLEDNIEYSHKTLELDTKANASALRDVVAHSIAPDRINQYLTVIKEASEDEIKGDPTARLKKYLDKGTLEKVKDAFNSPDVVNLPPGNTVYRLANAVSWLAQAKGMTAHKRLELERVSGQLLGDPGNKAVEI